jgi:hypothetical protein
MKKILAVLVLLSLTACATHQGTDGRTYAWIKPIGETPGGALAPTTGVKIQQYTINGKGYQIITPK